MNDVEETSVKKEEKQEISKKNSILRGILEVVVYVAIILVAVYLLPKYVVQRTIVSGRSMENNLKNEDNLLVNKFIYRFAEPERFDVIVFYPNGNEHPDTFGVYLKRLFRIESEEEQEQDDYYVKRIIGLPGETIQIIGDDIYVDGEILEEDYGKMAITEAGMAEEPIVLEDDEYFVLGDNRELSLDSRYDSVGPVKKELIAGKAILRIWPFDSFGTIK